MTFNTQKNPEFGTGCDARLLAGIMGHNLCLDIFGGPSAGEEAAGITPHGEGSVVHFDIDGGGSKLTMKAEMPLAQIRFGTQHRVAGHRQCGFASPAESLAAFDRPYWLDSAREHSMVHHSSNEASTQFRASATRSKVFESEFGADPYLKAGAEFEWPLAPQKDGAYMDLRVMNISPVSSGYTAHLMDHRSEHALYPRPGTPGKRSHSATSGSDRTSLARHLGGGHSRTGAPWNGQTLARGMEFGASPHTRNPAANPLIVAVSSARRKHTAGFQPKQCVEVEYWAILRPS